MTRTWAAARGLSEIMGSNYTSVLGAVNGCSNSHARHDFPACQRRLTRIRFAPVAALNNIFNELHYEMTRTIAEGGMGVVYEALQRGSGGFTKVVAVKLIRRSTRRFPSSRKILLGKLGWSPT